MKIQHNWAIYCSATGLLDCYIYCTSSSLSRHGLSHSDHSGRECQQLLFSRCSPIEPRKVQKEHLAHCARVLISSTRGLLQVSVLDVARKRVCRPTMHLFSISVSLLQVSIRAESDQLYHAPHYVFQRTSLPLTTWTIAHWLFGKVRKKRPQP